MYIMNKIATCTYVIKYDNTYSNDQHEKTWHSTILWLYNMPHVYNTPYLKNEPNYFGNNMIERFFVLVVKTPMMQLI